MFYSLPNLTGHDTVECPAPWDYKFITAVPAQVRADKEARQYWYMSPETNHQFYSPFEGVNKFARVNKESNPPHGSWAVVGDYDTKIPESTVLEAISGLKIKPTHYEISLSGYLRLIFLFESMALLGTYEYAVFFQQEAKKWLDLDVLPQLDEAALYSPSRLYCNGGIWKSTGAKPIPTAKIQSFQVKCGSKFNFKSSSQLRDIPLANVLPALKEKYGAAFDWPDAFELNSQGPTFWIPDSRSPRSAILKEGGMFTFAAHAEKPFYTWGDLLGKDFVTDFMDEAVSKATHNIWWDTKTFWRPDPRAAFYPDNDRGMELHLKTNCRLSTKPGDDGSSAVEKALTHTRENQRVESAAFFSFQPPGLYEYDGLLYLNRYYRKAIQPCAETGIVWGPTGKLPFISLLLDWEFVPNAEDQLSHFLSYSKVYYESAYLMKPCAGQNAGFQGGQGCGKTLISRFIMGALVGGYIDASPLIVEGGSFNATFFEYGHWSLDDDSALIGGKRSIDSVYAELKKYAANTSFTANQKFQRPYKTDWNGRIWLTVNTDARSRHLINSDTDLDKMNFYSCRTNKAEIAAFPFPNRQDTLGVIMKELPYYARYLLEYKIPDKWLDLKRWGVVSYQEPGMLDMARQASPTSLVKEILIDYLNYHFSNVDSDAASVTFPVSQLYSRLTSHSPEIMRSIRADAFSRHMDSMDQQVPAIVSTGPGNTKIWTFNRTDFASPKETKESLKELGSGDFNAPTHDSH
jgi:hypothetical protein